MVFQQGRRKPGDESYLLGTSQEAGRPGTQSEAICSTSDYSTVTLLARFRG